MARRGVAIPTCFSTLLVASFLANTATASGTVTAAPALGLDAPAGPGWSSYFITVHGSVDGGTRGSVELTDGAGGKSRAPVAVAPREGLDVELPWRDAFGKGLEAILRDESGQPVDRFTLPSTRSRVPLLFDLGPTRRLENALRGERVAIRSSLTPWAPASGTELAATHAARDARSGEPRLPARGLGYGAVTVALSPSDLIEALDARSFAALADWVTGGGTLAISVSHPEDLQKPRLAALIGAPVTTALSTATASFVDFDVVDEATASAPPPATYAARRVTPSEDVSSRLLGFHGETLRATRYGAAATRGFGEVALLAFDPTAPAFVDDAWVRRTMVELVREGWDRESRVAFALGNQAPGESRLDAVRRILDPNEGSRWAIGLAAVLLVLYAVLALPLTFRRAARRNMPLRALVELPLLSFGTLVAIVLIGAVAKGGRSRARRVSLIECGTEATRGAVTRFRGFFASSAKSLQVKALDPSSLLDVDSTSVTRTLVLDRDVAALEDLQGRPWETLLVREDGFTDLGGSVRLGDGSITNHLTHPLIGVVAHAPGDNLRYFARIDPGVTAALDAGTPLGSPVAVSLPISSPGRSGSALEAHRLESYRFAHIVDGGAPGAGDVWSAFEFAASDATDFWPADTPVLIAQIENGDDAPTDSGLALERARLFVRVVGNGRAP